MPQAVYAWVATTIILAGGATAAAVVAGVVIGSFAYLATVVAISYGLAALSSALMGRPKQPGPQFRDIVVKSTIAPRAVVYGEATVGGVLVYINTTGTKNEYLDFVIAVAGHQVEAITDVWFDDILIPAASIGGGAAGGGVVTSGKYRQRDGYDIARIDKYLGTEAQTAPTLLTATDFTGYNPFYDDGPTARTEWTSDYRLQGVAYVHIRLRRHTEVYESGPPSNFKFKVRGAKVYDPRKDSTNGGTGTHRLTDATTWEWSANPALCVADYIVGGTIVNDAATPVRRRGFGAATGDVDWPAVIAAANICDEDVTIPPASPPTTQNRYECHGMLAPSDQFPDADCLEQLVTSMLGQVVYTAGKYRVYAGAYDAPTYTLTEADLAGALSVTTGSGRADRYNYVRGTRHDADLGSEVEFLPRTDTSYQTEDGRTLYHDISLPMVTNEYRAQRIGQTILRRSREQEIVTWPGQLSCAKVAIWETVSISVAELGMSSKVFRCIGRKVRLGGEGAPVELLLREEFSTTYSDPIVADYGTPVVTTVYAPQSDALDAPTAFSAVSVRGAIEFSITPAATQTPSEIVFEIFEHTSSTPFASSALIWTGSATQLTIQKSDTTARYYWVRARRGPAVSGHYPAVTGISGEALPPPTDGQDGQDGVTPITLSLSPLALQVICDYTGAPKNGESTKSVAVKVYEGATDRTSGATITISSTTNCSASYSGGIASFSAPTASSGNFEVQAVYSGQTVKQKCTFAKVIDAPPLGSVELSADPVNGTSTTYNTNGPVATIAATSTTLTWSYDITYWGASITAGNQTFTMDAKLEYRAVGGNYADVTGSATTGSASYWHPEGYVENGGVTDNGTLTVTQGTTYEVRLTTRKNSSSNRDIDGSYGSFTVAT